jgi:hypothetical protein|tara:strand:+ start:4423 stop:4614 length:192 start_codon:yes stop_codon:yes gene_type:complete
MDDAQQIDRLIEVMQELQVLVEELNVKHTDPDIIISMIVALITTTQVPNVTILPNIKDEVAFA